MKKLNQYEKLNPMAGRFDGAGSVVKFVAISIASAFLGIWTVAAVIAGSVPAAALAGFGWAILWPHLRAALLD